MSEMNLCVQRKMKIISEESPELTKKRRLGKAFGICKNVKEERDFQLIFDFAEQIRHDIVPMQLLDKETGVFIRGKPNQPNTNQLMIPVVSEDVRGLGIFGSELIVQFHNSPGTYRYQMGNNDTAQTVFKQFYTAGSKGKWLWRNIRGHVKGQPKPYNWGMSYGGPGLSGGTGAKVPTIGGTTASLLPYRIGKKTPIGKMGRFMNFEKMAKVLKQYKRDPISMVQQTGIEPTMLLPAMFRFIAKMTGKPISLTVPSIVSKLAKSPSFKSGAQVIQGIQELRARSKLKGLQPGNIVRGVI